MRVPSAAACCGFRHAPEHEMENSLTTPPQRIKCAHTKGLGWLWGWGFDRQTAKPTFGQPPKLCQRLQKPTGETSSFWPNPFLKLCHTKGSQSL